MNNLKHQIEALFNDPKVNVEVTEARGDLFVELSIDPADPALAWPTVEFASMWNDDVEAYVVDTLITGFENVAVADMPLAGALLTHVPEVATLMVAIISDGDDDVEGDESDSEQDVVEKPDPQTTRPSDREARVKKRIFWSKIENARVWDSVNGLGTVLSHDEFWQTIKVQWDGDAEPMEYGRDRARRFMWFN